MNEKEIEIMADADTAQNIALMAKREILERGITVVPSTGTGGASSTGSRPQS